jgi:predicted TIM-barrel fold metal-dependent hydrolase
MGGASTTERRLRGRVPQSAWWGTPARNTRDLATAILPGLLYERMDELGIDFTVLYPTKAMGMAGMEDEDLRRGLCHGLNRYAAEYYAPYRDRITVSGVVPMHSPQEAVEEIRHCQELGLKVVGMPEGVLRRIDEPGAVTPWLTPGQTHWFDLLGHDSLYDYDPVWAELDAHNFAATFHGGLGNMMPYTFTSTQSYVFNHIGFFAQRMQRLCKSLFLGGVTNRFPTLNFAFLECGVGWACSMLVDLVEHWEKRNIEALHHELDPALVDYELLEQLFRSYAPELLAGRSEDEVQATLRAMPAIGVPPPEIDEFAAVGITKKSDIADKFVPRFYFGCEADDRTIAFAFSPANAFGATLRPVFSSDISHWDVEDMASVVDEAYGLVRKDVLTEDQFRQFVFDNPVRLFQERNPHFFDGTAVESAAATARP